jgi:pyruvate dehydrogenase E1 component alpha subunit
MQHQLARQFLYDMTLARQFEQAAAEQYTQGHIGGFLHLYPGEEAVAVGSLRAAERGDYVVSTYREHVHAMVWGVSPREVMAELFGRATGCSGGYGGSMHLFDAERRFLGGYAIVGETFPVAAGIGYWLRLNQAAEVVMCYFGDGAANQGTFHETLNMAALWKLPVLFICENNHYQIGTEIHRHSAVPEIYRRASAYGIDGKRVDGMDVLAVYEATHAALQHVRAGNGPHLIECETYRYRGHSMADSGAYRSALEVAELRARDPLESFRQRALKQGWLNDADCRKIAEEVNAEVEDAVRFAAESPPPTQLDRGVYSQPLDLYGRQP